MLRVNYLTQGFKLSSLLCYYVLLLPVGLLVLILHDS